MKLNFVQRINLFFWALFGNARLKEYNKNIEKGMNQVMAYKQAVAFAPVKINYREIKVGHLVLDNEVPTKVVSCNWQRCEVLDDDNQPAKRQWKDIHPIRMKMNWLVHYGFTCKATVWYIEGTQFYVAYFSETGWHVMEPRKKCQGELIKYVHELQDAFEDEAGYKLSLP